MTTLFFAAPVISGSEGFYLPHVQILLAKMWDKFLAKLSDYQILRKKSAAYSYLSDFYPVTLSVESPRVVREATGDSFVQVPSA
jgi:hypothetical protein